MLIRLRPNFEEFPRHFRVPFPCNFSGWKIHIVTCTFFDVILLVERSTFFPRTFFDVISMVKKSTLMSHLQTQLVNFEFNLPLASQNLHLKTRSSELVNYLPNGHTTSNPRRFDVDITLMGLRPNFRVPFRCNFNGWKIHVVYMYFFRGNFAGRTIHVVSTYIFRCNFNGQKIYVVSMYFFWCNLSGQSMHLVFT